MNNYLKTKLLTLVLACTVFFVYSNSLLNDFVWDDEEQIVNNTVIRDWSSVPLIFKSSTFYGGGAGLSGGFYRPLMSLSYLFNYKIWGLNPAGFRIFQLVLHALNAVLLFFLARSIFYKAGAEHAQIAAFFSALIFAVHPANVESVAYIACAGELIYTFLILSGAILFIKSFNGGQIAGRKPLLLFFVLVFMALLAKESAIMILPIMAVYLMIFVKPRFFVYAECLFYTAVIISFYLVLRLGIAGIAAAQSHLAMITQATLQQRLLTVPYEIVSYLGIIFFPKDLSIYRNFVVHSAADSRFWLSLMLIAFIGAAVMVYIKKMRSKAALFFLLWFAIALVPVLNIIPLDMTMAERWLYVPAMGLFAIFGMAVITAIEKMSPFGKKAAYAVLVCAILALGIRTIARNEDWKNGITLYGHDAKIGSRISPQGSFELENNYGVELYRAGNVDEAERRFRRSVELQPNWSISQNNLGAILEKRGDDEGALEHYRKSISISDYYLAYDNTAGMLIKLKRYQQAKDFLESALAKFPRNPDLKVKLAMLYWADGILSEKGDAEMALRLVLAALGDDPGNQDAARLYYAIKNKIKFNI